ncbi:MAG: T9SS type A sorting domain-containing protein [Ignavibacteriae bacterium]|nr:T9SS type A sorting domain-containing protein [Ignavibacteriota bacterium]
MRKKILLFVLLFLSAGNLFPQDQTWITPNKTYLKIYIAEDGMYRLDKNDFTNAGINTNAIDPKTIKLYNKGVQIPIYFFGEENSVFDPTDYLDFYGKKNYGGITNTYDHNNNVAYTTFETYDSYSDTNVYWIGWDGDKGIRYGNSINSSGTSYPNTFFNDVVHFERDYFYSQGEMINSSDLRILQTEKFRGEGWYWSTLYDNQTLSDTVSLPDLASTPQTASFRVFAYPVNRSTSILNEHSLQLIVNGNIIATISVNDINKIDSTVTFSSSLLSNFAVNNIAVKYVPNGGYSGSMYIDLMEIQYPRKFKFSASKLSADLGGSDTTSKKFSISGFNQISPVNIYDVNNYFRIANSTVTADTLKFTGKSNAKFVVVNNNITKKPLRVKQKSVPDLVSTSNGADYMIIYNKNFLAQAEQLRAYRQQKDNFRSVKAEIEDIYDIFNFGIENPAAVRQFTTYVYNNWQLPKMQYVCLFGRASLDPKGILSSSAFKTNYVPTYGNPPSDGYFVNFNIGSYCYYDQIAVGRLPAYYPSEAQTMVDKIIAYESQSPDNWSKDFIYITGGGTISEQLSHQSKSNIEISNYIAPPSISGDAHKIYRTDTSGSATFNIKDSIKNDISRGALFVNFRGHAGSHDWEVAMNDPGTLTNGNKLPIILSLTCFTGENSKADYRGFGERFVYFADKGAIGFVGTTGWSYAQYGNDFGTHIVQTLKSDTTRRLGQLTKYAHGKMSRDSLAFSIRHTLNCYNLIGDPAVTLNLPRRPELSINNTEYSLSNNFPSVGEFVTLTAYPKNFGLYCDSNTVRFQIKKNNINYLTKDTVLKFFKFEDTLRYTFKIDSSGVYSASITLDYNNWVPLENKSNNTINLSIPVKNTAFVPLKPVTNSALSTDSVEFTCLNPRVQQYSNNLKVMLQFDTTAQFNSPLLKSFASTSVTGVVTKFKTSIPALSNNRIYFWRTNCIVNNDTTGWSSVQNFIYNNSLSTSLSRNDKSEDNSPASSIVLLKNNKSQFNQSDYVNTNYNSGGIQLSDYSANLFVRSYGSNAEESSYFSIGGKNIYIDGGLNTGLNLLKVKKLNGNILSFRNFKMNTGTSNDSLVNFLNTFDSTQYLMLLNAAYVPGGVYLSTAAKTKLRQFGSIYCDSIGLISYFHTWSLIGYLGATGGQVSEMFDPCCRPAPNCVSCDHWTESLSNKNVIFKKSEGSVSNIVGPAKTWTNFSWTQTLFPNSSIKFDVYGVDLNNIQTLLYSNIQTNTNFDLSAINASAYPKLNLVAKFNIDTLTGSSSSVLNSIKVNYTAPPEITWDVNNFKFTYTEGNDATLKYSLFYYNAGYSDITGSVFSLYKINTDAQNLIKSDTISSPLTVDNFQSVNSKAPILGLRNNTKLILVIKSKDNGNEFYTYNNTAEMMLNVNSNSSPVSMLVYNGDRILNSGDQVSKKPELKISISDPEFSGSIGSDTTRLKVSLNNKYVPYFKSGKYNDDIRLIETDNRGSGTGNSLMFLPELQNGQNNLALIYNNGQGLSDTLSLDVFVSDELGVRDFYNYPNPMKNETSFIFNLTGSVVPDKFKIKIYTISGRLIKTIEAPVNIGNNNIPWDGRDEDGDYIANGTYIYKLITEDDIDFVTLTQKLVVLR